MEIRLLTVTDANKYWDLRLEALKQSPEAFSSSHEEAIQQEAPIERVANNLSAEGNFTFGAFEQGELLGAVTLLQEKSLKLNHKANIYAMYVTPRKRGLGLGKALLSAAINQARKLTSIEKLNLTVVTTNEQAKKLYSSLGFKVFGMEVQALKINGQYFDEEYLSLFLK